MVKFRKSLFVFALIATIIIFIGGVFLGYYMDNFRVDDLDTILKQSELDTESFFVENYFSDVFGLDDCNIANTRFNDYSEKLVYIGNILTKYDKTKLFKARDYEILRRRYFLLELKTYVLIKDMKDKCGLDSFYTILFFYDPDDEDSLRQGYTLDKVVLRKNNLYIFSIDRTFQEPFINTVKQYYNISKSPTIILDYNIKNEGFISYAEINEILS